MAQLAALDVKRRRIQLGRLGTHLVGRHENKVGFRFNELSRNTLAAPRSPKLPTNEKAARSSTRLPLKRTVPNRNSRLARTGSTSEWKARRRKEKRRSTRRSSKWPMLK